MNIQFMLRRTALLGIAVALTACAKPAKPLYQWGAYQTAVYQYMKTNGEQPGAQIQQLEVQLQKTAVKGQATPPGLHGHLALLYSKVGDQSNAIRHLELERKLFPESATYVDYLLKNAGAPANKS